MFVAVLAGLYQLYSLVSISELLDGMEVWWKPGEAAPDRRPESDNCVFSGFGLFVPVLLSLITPTLSLRSQIDVSCLMAFWLRSSRLFTGKQTYGATGRKAEVFRWALQSTLIK
jgi:hypothetical protein